MARRVSDDLRGIACRRTLEESPFAIPGPITHHARTPRNTRRARHLAQADTTTGSWASTSIRLRRPAHRAGAASPSEAPEGPRAYLPPTPRALANLTQDRGAEPLGQVRDTACVVAGYGGFPWTARKPPAPSRRVSTSLSPRPHKNGSSAPHGAGARVILLNRGAGAREADRMSTWAVPAQGAEAAH